MSRHPFQWPSDLFVELQTMESCQFLADLLCHKLIPIARQMEIEGLAVDPSNGQLFLRSLTAEQLLLILQENQDDLQKDLPNVETLQQQLQTMINNSTPGSKSIVAWDDNVSPKVLPSFCVMKDAREKRLTLVLLDADNDTENDKDAVVSESSGCISLGLNLPTTSTSEWSLPASIVNQMPVDTVGIHPTLYQTVYGPNPYLASASPEPIKDEADQEALFATTTLYHRIAMGALKPLFRMYPKYKLYVTGHGPTAAASATLAAFSLSTAPTTPKPVSCFTTATPRVGDYRYLQAATALETLRFLRTARIVLQGDACRSRKPCWGLSHAGFQVELIKDTPPKKQETKDETLPLTADQGADSSEGPEIAVTYPKLEDTCWNRMGRAWRNAHGQSAGFFSENDYYAAIQAHQEALQSCDLNELYADEEVVGYEIAPLPVEK